MKTYPQINPVTGMIIQQQSVMLERLADALQKCLYIIGDPSASADKLWRTDDELNDAYHTSIEALAAYEAVKGEPVANPIDEAVRRMEAIPIHDLKMAYRKGAEILGLQCDAVESIRVLLISAAKGVQP